VPPRAARPTGGAASFEPDRPPGFAAHHGLGEFGRAVRGPGADRPGRPATWPRSTRQSFDRLIQDRRSGEKSWRSPEHSRHGITATSPWAAALSPGSLSIPNPLIANWSASAACHLEGTPGCPTRRRNYPGPASVFLSSAHRHTVFDPVRRDDRWADSPEKSPPPADSARPNQSSQRPWGWPYSGPRTARIGGVNAGESLGLCRGSCRTNQQVSDSVVLARKCRSGTLTRKRSLVQIQYGPHILNWPFDCSGPIRPGLWPYVL
jgi:hypothetical protein